MAQREPQYLRGNSTLVRRAAIRRILHGRYDIDGIATYEQLIEHLAAMGILAKRSTVMKDVKEMGGFVAQREDKASIKWLCLPAFNPAIEDLRSELDPNLIEAEVAFKIAHHVVDLTPIDRFIYLMTEPRAGAIVAYWLGWLNWRGILLVQESMDCAVIHCLTQAAALDIATKLVGYQVPEELREGDSDDER